MEQAVWCRVVSLLAVCWLAAASRRLHLDIQGSGASFPNNVYQAWMTYYVSTRLDYVALHFKYEPVGSGTGKRRITGAEGPRVDFAGSDSLLDEKVKEQFPDIRMFPTMAGLV